MVKFIQKLTKLKVFGAKQKGTLRHIANTHLPSLRIFRKLLILLQEQTIVKKVRQYIYMFAYLEWYVGGPDLQKKVQVT